MNQVRLSLLFSSVMMVMMIAGPAFADSGGGEIYYTKPLKSVLFSHKLHADELGLTCDMCHMKLFDMQALAAQEKTDFTMNSLYKGKYCGACHDGKIAFASNTQCARCHGGVKEYDAALEKEKKNPSPKVSRAPKTFVYKLKDTGAVTFSHESHLQSFSCKDCHAGLFALKKGGSKMKMDSMYSGGFCGKCHNGKIATDITECAKCHAQ
ncbi:MAG: cytochrome c3 family protein [Nitrospirae bacterium]|nr:cytochrome c3 family protein [Nitrospirota bacterium]